LQHTLCLLVLPLYLGPPFLPALIYIEQLLIQLALLLLTLFKQFPGLPVPGLLSLEFGSCMLPLAPVLVRLVPYILECCERTLTVSAHVLYNLVLSPLLFLARRQLSLQLLNPLGELLQLS
jgi:hypothetical protein